MPRALQCPGSPPVAGGVGDFRKLVAWRRSHALAVSVYRLTAHLPEDERFNLARQMRRAALSVSSNLAEGCGRRGDTELRRFIRIAEGSLAELECQLLIAQDLQLLENSPVVRLLDEIRQIRGMLDRLHGSLTAARKT